MNPQDTTTDLAIAMMPTAEYGQMITTDVEPTQLSINEKQQVNQAFEEADDFRAIGERITAPIDSIIVETMQVIESDPIMDVSKELSTMNKEVQSVYDDIIDNDGMIMKIAKMIPIISFIANTIDAKWDEARFNMKKTEEQIEAIFAGFDTAYNSLGVSIDMQKKFLLGIDENLGKVLAYQDFLQLKIAEFNIKYDEKEGDEKVKYEMFLRNVEYFASNLVVLTGNLQMARKRLLMRMDSSYKLSLAMSSSRPIFKTLLSTALIETSAQKAIDASMTALETMGETIDKMNSELTDKAIDAAKRAEELTSKPILSTSIFIDNVSKLKNHFEQIDSFRNEVDIQAAAEKVAFEDAQANLEQIKVLTSTSQEDFIKAISE